MGRSLIKSWWIIGKKKAIIADGIKRLGGRIILVIISWGKLRGIKWRKQIIEWL
jgi:hypothetical protein